MWAAHHDELVRGRRFVVECDGRPVAYSEVVQRWRADAAFRSWFNSVLAADPFPTFRWETPPLTAGTADRPFEFVLRHAPELLRFPPEPETFADHFLPGESVVTFPNLGRDALLVVPCPLGDPTAYGHLAAFVRLAPELQRDALWRAVGEAVAGRIGAKPVWVNTAGAGVSWLHVRLDDRPKYYGHEPYRAFPSPRGAA